MIRQLATESFDARRSWGAVFRESKIGLGTGIFMALLAYVGVMFLSHNSMLATVMALRFCSTCCSEPLRAAPFRSFCRPRPRSGAGVQHFLTALTDSGGFFFFLDCHDVSL